MSHVDPWEKAAECARAVKAAADPRRRAVLTNLQNLWIGLANELDCMTPEEAAAEAEKIGRLHIEWGGAPHRDTH